MCFGASERLRTVKAELLQEGISNEAMSGVDTMFHTACSAQDGPGGGPQVLYFFPFSLIFLSASFESKFCKLLLDALFSGSGGILGQRGRFRRNAMHSQ